jgi:uncharacterized membrane protein
VTWLRAAILVLSIIGAAIAAYLTYVHYAHVAPICTSGGCEEVQRSSYAEIAGVPVALLGLLAYCAIAATTLRGGLTAAVAGVVLALGGAAFSGYLLWAQLGPIGAICQWCLGNDAVIGVIALLSVARLLTEPA